MNIIHWISRSARVTHWQMMLAGAICTAAPAVGLPDDGHEKAHEDLLGEVTKSWERPAKGSRACSP